MVDELQRRREMKALEEQANMLFEAIENFNVILAEDMENIPEEHMEKVRAVTH